MNWEVLTKHLHYISKYHDCFEKKHLCDCVSGILEKPAKGKLIFLASRHFGGNEWNEPVTSKKISVFVADDKIQALKRKFEFWKTCICHQESENFPTLKDFSAEISGDLTNNNFVLLCNKMCQHLEELHNTVNFPNDQSTMWQNYALVKDQSARPINGF